MDPNDKYSFSSDDDEGAGFGTLNPAAKALLDRSTTLLTEVESFQRSLRRRASLERTVELRLFLNQVKSEHRCLQGLAFESPDSPKSRHGVRASNLPYLEALWTHAKASTGITALCKTFSYTELGADGRKLKKRGSVTVDIVAQNGLQWIKLSLLTPRRLLFEIAKAGWEEHADDDSSYTTSSETAEETPSSETAEETPSSKTAEETPSSLDPTTPTAALATSSTSLSRLADTLLLAASQTRIQYLHPTITFVLPNLPPTTPEVQAFLTSLQQKGVTITTPTATFSAPSITDLVSTLASPLSRRVLPLSHCLNLDTTILLALVSDISHNPSIPAEPRFHPAILRQLEIEAERPMVPELLLPILAHHLLMTCTSAYTRFHDIVAIVASPTERARADLLFPPKTTTLTPEELGKRFQEISVHTCETLRLPVEVVPDHVVTLEDPPGFHRVAGKLSAINRAAFITGWSRGVTTVTSNRVVAKFVQAACSAPDLEIVGPDVEVVENARSLVGRAKRIEL